MRHEAKCFVLAVEGMLMVASAAGQQFQLMEASINEIHRGFRSRCICKEPGIVTAKNDGALKNLVLDLDSIRPAPTAT